MQSSGAVRRSLATTCLLALLAAGCSTQGAGPDQPFFTEPPRLFTPAGNILSAELIAICYNRLTTPPERITEMIVSSCRDPQFVSSDYVGNCTLSAPVRVTYSCSGVDRELAAPAGPFLPF